MRPYLNQRSAHKRLGLSWLPMTQPKPKYASGSLSSSARSEATLLVGNEIGAAHGTVGDALDVGVVPNVDRGRPLEPLRNSGLSDADLLRECLLGEAREGDRALDGVDGVGGCDVGHVQASEVVGLSNSSAAYKSCQMDHKRRALRLVLTGPSVPGMSETDHKKAKPSRADLRAAKRLKDIWLALPRRDRPTQEELGERFPEGASQSLISQYLNGVIPLNLGAVLFFARELNCRPEDIYPDLPSLDGVAPLIRNLASGERGQVGRGLPTDQILIRRFDVRASMGIGLPAPEVETMVGALMVSKEWFRNELRQVSNADDLAVLTGYGDSMEGTFSDGAQLLVDRGVTDVKVDAVYVLSLNSELYVKRLQRRPNGSILMISDNKKYEPYLIQDGERDRFMVLGRVVGVWNFAKI